MKAVVLDQSSVAQDALVDALRERDITIVGVAGTRQGATELAAELNALIVSYPVNEAPATGALRKLSGREIEVLVLMSKGLSAHEIADALHISAWTVRNHFSHMFEKLQLRGINSRVQAAVLAAHSGLL